MGTYTAKLKLYKPSVNEVGWETKLNENFDKIDAIKPEQLGAEPAIIKKTAFNKEFGNTEGTVCQGNDPRLSQAKEVPPHASETTKYGVATASLYGHAKASKTEPKDAGSSSYGTEVHLFARPDHVHPSQTSVPGNASVSEKLVTARNIGFSGGVMSTPTAFDGTKDISIPISKINASLITGDISPSLLPNATTTQKGCVVVGDNLEINDEGVLKVKGSGETKVAYKVYSEGTTTENDIVFGVLGYKLKAEPNRDMKELVEPITVLLSNVKCKCIPSSFTKSDTLPTVFEYYRDETTTYTVKNISYNVHLQCYVDCTFLFIRNSDAKTFATVEVKKGVIYEGPVVFPEDWDIYTDTFNVVVSTSSLKRLSVALCIIHTTDELYTRLYL